MARMNPTLATTVARHLEKFPDPVEASALVRVAPLNDETCVVTFGGPMKRENRDLFVKTLDGKYVVCLAERDFGAYPGVVIATRGSLN